MPVTPVICPKQPLSRDLDVSVSISRPQTELATDMTMIAFVTPSVDFSDGGNDRVRFYSTFEALVGDVGINTPAYWAGNAFFARSERPTTMCVGQVFTSPTPATLRGGTVSIPSLQGIDDGGFDIVVNGELQQIRGLNFTGVATINEAAAVVAAKIADVQVSAQGGGLVLQTALKGDGAEISYASAPGDAPKRVMCMAYSSAPVNDAAVKAVTNGGMILNFDGAVYTISGVDLSAATTDAEVAQTLQGAVAAAGLPNVDIQYGNGTVALSAEAQEGSGGWYAAAAPATGEDLAAILNLTDLVSLQVPMTETAQPALLEGSTPLDYAAIAALGANAEIKIADKTYTVDLSGVTDAASLQTALATAMTADYTVTVTHTVTVTGKGTQWVSFVAPGTVGDALKLSQASLPRVLRPVATPAVPVVVATDVSGILALAENVASSNTYGYTPGDLVSEINLIATAARCAGNAVYGWVIDAQYRDTQEQKNVAVWAEARTPAYFSACTNSPQAYNSADTSNIGYFVQANGYKRTSVIYHNNAQVYPDMSYIALALSVDYALPNSTLTMKFKELDGIEPSPLTESQLAVLTSRNINAYVAIGNTARTTREGTQGRDTWYTDSLVNLDNFAEELQVSVYNAFLRNKKIPYTEGGQNILISAAALVCNRYVRNGTFAPRDVEAPNTEEGFTTYPATNIVPAPITGATASDRGKRLAPPLLITAYEAGAFHKVNVAVSVYN